MSEFQAVLLTCVLVTIVVTVITSVVTNVVLAFWLGGPVELREVPLYKNKEELAKEQEPIKICRGQHTLCDSCEDIRREWNTKKR